MLVGDHVKEINVECWQEMECKLQSPLSKSDSLYAQLSMDPSLLFNTLLMLKC